MNCPVRTGQTGILVEHASGRLQSELAGSVNEHAATCPECTSILKAQSKVQDALSEWTAEPVSADFDRRLFQRIEEDHGRTFFQRLVAGFSWKPAASLAGAIATAAIVALLVSPPEQRSARPANEQTIRNVEAEQIEVVLDDIDMLQQLNSGGGTQAL
ncbi:MAG: hypothetical protein H7039_13170 [Bryobacteraceae bacterium]|nr:hypothetical protein [Bryobacteraceae bacterium]